MLKFISRPPGFMKGDKRFGYGYNPTAGFPGPGKYDPSTKLNKLLHSSYSKVRFWMGI